MTGAPPVVLDWRQLVDEPEIHACGCPHCPVDGELEPIAWPALFTTLANNVPHVTDRWVSIRADRAPIPDGYEGPVDDTASLRPAFTRATATDQPATDLRFWPSTLKALELTGWRLRLLVHRDDAPRLAKRVVAVVDERGEQIGLTLATSHGAGDLYEEP
jgi:hypothetical protein